MADSTSIYAKPMNVEGADGCNFYHVMELPGLGLVGQRDIGWDLRSTIDTYLGEVEFKGKRALDVGAASGYLTFEMERRGADVVSIDLSDPDKWDLVPFANPAFDATSVRQKYRSLVQGRIRAYWLAHRLLGSRARAYYGDVYSLPDALGPVDIAVLGMVLGHVRDPFAALQSVTRLVRETVVITEQAPQIEGAYAHFMPDPDGKGVDNAWWATSEDCRRRMLGVLGFEEVRLRRLEHYSQFLGRGEVCSTQVFNRVYPVPAAV